ncbi:hypothetical protein GJ496_000198 [Pomphorhynchus laevis]|nr:hypothetical protein GJ496_000198 [Pomphorhynchus laevis]
MITQICGSDGINAINEQLNNERSKKQDECVQGVVKRLKDSHTYVEEDDIRHSDSESLWSFDQIDTDEESTAYTDAAGDHTTISEIERFKSDHGFISIQVDMIKPELK